MTKLDVIHDSFDPKITEIYLAFMDESIFKHIQESVGPPFARGVVSLRDPHR